MVQKDKLHLGARQSISQNRKPLLRVMIEKFLGKCCIYFSFFINSSGKDTLICLWVICIV